MQNFFCFLLFYFEGEEQYCTVSWEDYSGFAAVPKSSFITLTNDIEKYSLYPVEVNGVQRKAKVLLKGTRNDNCVFLSCFFRASPCYAF